MKLWDSLTTCLILLSAVHASSLLRSRRHTAQRSGRAAESPLETPPVQGRLSGTSPSISAAEADTGEWGQAEAGRETYIMEEPPLNELEDVVDFIKGTVSRLRRASSSTAPSPAFSSATPSPSKDGSNIRTRRRRGRKKGASQQVDKRRRGTPGKGETERKVRGGGGGGGRRRGQGCVLKQIHLNVTDLGLGYRSSEEMIFRYCSGPCRKSETNYDKILQNLVHNRRFPSREAPPQACCRPIAFDDDLSFLDDNLVYHTVRKHSARKCGCV